MSETTGAVQKTAFSRTYRGMKIKRAVAVPAVSVLETRDFNIGPYKKVEIVVTGKEDYQALVMSHKDECGITYIQKLAKLQGKDFFKDGLGLAPANEFGDVSVLPETLAEGQAVLAEGAKASKEIEALAAKLGITSEQLLKAFQDGTLGDKITAANTEGEVNIDAN